MLQFLDRNRLPLLLWGLLSAGFFVVTLGSYQVSRDTIREAILARELPLTSSNIYSEIQKDLVRPVLISSTMAQDTFLRDWVLAGEREPERVIRYLQEIKERYGAQATFFVSESSRRYYTGTGIRPSIREGSSSDDWYFRVRDLQTPYEINVDIDARHDNALTIFVNYRVLDFAGRFIGVTGIGLSVDSVQKLLEDYRQRYRRSIYFVDANGQSVPIGHHGMTRPKDLRSAEGLGPLIDRIIGQKSGSFEYDAGGSHRLLNVSFVPELNWYLFVENGEEEALRPIRRTLHANLGIALVSTLVVMFLVHLVVRRHQDRIERMAATDKLTGLLNRQALDVIIARVAAEARRSSRPSVLLLADIDHFKSINDRFGHLAGDRVLQRVAHLLRQRLRASDVIARWGGEEFLVVLPECSPEAAYRLADELRCGIEGDPVDLGDGKMIAVTMSIGVSHFYGKEPVEAAIARADAGLYEAKRSGRNRVCLHTADAPLAA